MSTSSPTLEPDAPNRPSAPKHGFFERLYTGTGGFEIVGRRRFFYMLSAAFLLLSLLSIAVRGFTLGIDFAGGSRIQLPASDTATTQQVEDVYTETIGHEPVTVQKVGSGDSATIQVRSESLDLEQTVALQTALFDEFQPKNADGEVTRNAISIAEISETWGSQITRQAVIALLVFVVLTMIYIAIRFERDMSIAAISSLFFNLVVTAGIYSLVGFEVTPAAVIGLLTILGFVLYDNVVVFDKVEENTRGVLHLTRRTYAEQANLAANQTLMRSINTTVIGILPIIGMLVIAVWLLGVGTLKDLALVQLVGMIVGAYSSIFFAVPVLVSIKERWGPVAAHTKKVLAKRSGAAGAKAAAAGERRAGSAAGREVSETPRRTRDTGPRAGARPSGKRHRKSH
ncbi:protein translocase subunit SecF [Nocardia cyriacigeorgica]|uniref:Protein-export membrane protein SecF n=1 Tax=Nocardia cyriacigeorgica TaxID=135487 RepID=A0A6P1D1S7_9NOCA|nr:protein translocase subunit SecF [Nocardia cyriacigeorgica]NEW42993.1 protein translocase subunit SecF [Nocardia cyriacigeorgica]NEW55461.1 protein translocase subunit SecF [Nocardia cyriacigeorgica]